MEANTWARKSAESPADSAAQDGHKMIQRCLSTVYFEKTVARFQKPEDILFPVTTERVPGVWGHEQEHPGISFKPT